MWLNKMFLEKYLQQLLFCRELIDMIFILTLQVCQNQNMDVLSLLSISFIQTGQVVRSLNVIILLQKLLIALELQ